MAEGGADLDICRVDDRGPASIHRARVSIESGVHLDGGGRSSHHNHRLLASHEGGLTVSGFKICGFSDSWLFGTQFGSTLRFADFADICQWWGWNPSRRSLPIAPDGPPGV